MRQDMPKVRVPDYKVIGEKEGGEGKREWAREARVKRVVAGIRRGGEKEFVSFLELQSEG